MTTYFSLGAFKISLSSTFVNGTMMHLSIDHFGFGVYGISLMCRLVFFSKFGKFSAIISLYILPASFFCSPPSGPPIMHALAPTGLLELCLFLFSFYSPH